MSSFASLACYSALKELKDSKIDLITAYSRMIAPIILQNASKKNYDIYSIQKDVKNEYSLTIPYPAMQSILSKCHELGYITYEGRIIKPNQQAIEQDDFESIRDSKEKQYKLLINAYKKFLKEKYQKHISDETAYEQINEFIENNDLSFIQDSKSLYGKERWKLAEFLIECEENGKTNFIDYLNEYIIGLSLTQLISYEEDNEKFTFNNLQIFLDTPILFRLLGIDTLRRSSIYIDLIHQMQKRGITVKIFDHTYNELIGIIEDSKYWINNPNFDETLANETSYFFVSENWSKFDVDEFSLMVRKKIESDFNIQITTTSYPTMDSFGSIHESDIVDMIKAEYSQSKNRSNTQVNGYSIEIDAKSLFFTLQLCQGKPIYHLNDIKYLFLTTNQALSKVALSISKKITQGNTSSIIPFAIDDINWGTILWIDTPGNMSKYSRSKLTAAAYASYKPSDNIIKKFQSSLIKLYQDGSISAAECYLLRTQPSARSLLLKITQNDEEKYLDQTPLEIIKQYKNEGYIQGIREKEEEITRINQQNHNEAHVRSVQYSQLQVEKESESIRADLAEKKLALNQKKHIEDTLSAEIQALSVKYEKAKLVNKCFNIIVKIFLSLISGFLLFRFFDKIVCLKDQIEICISAILALFAVWGLPKLNVTLINKFTEKISRRIIFLIYKVETIENNLREKKNLVEEIRTDIKKIEEEIDILESQQKSMVAV